MLVTVSVRNAIKVSTDASILKNKKMRGANSYPATPTPQTTTHTQHSQKKTEKKMRETFFVVCCLVNVKRKKLKKE